MTDRTNLLILGEKLPALEDLLCTDFQLHRISMTDNRGKQLEKLSHLIKGIAVSSHFPIDRDLMMRLPHLQIIACCSVGLRKDFSVKLVKGVESRWGSC